MYKYDGGTPCVLKYQFLNTKKNDWKLKSELSKLSTK